MKNFSKAAALAALGLVLAGRVQAVTLYTPPASTSFASEYLHCDVINVRATPVDVVIEIHTYGGSVTNSVSASLAPGHMTYLDGYGAGQAYCKFIVSGSKNAVRANAQYYDFANDVTTAVIPAR